jgi:hypothetical protein
MGKTRKSNVRGGQATMTSKQRRKPPSRIKYEKDNPTVSARLPLEIRAKLLANLKILDMSLTDALKGLAGELEIKVIPVEEARKAGYEEARKHYMIIYKCAVCGKYKAIESPQAKAAAARYMTEHGWCHAECRKQAKKS